METGRKVVLGLGGLLSGDEGLGIHALRALGGRLGPRHGVELLDGGADGTDGFSLIKACSHLLVLCAVDAMCEPGSLIELGRAELQSCENVKLFEYYPGFRDALGTAVEHGLLPAQLRLLGMQPAEFAAGLALSPAVEESLTELVERAVNVLGEWGLLHF